MQKNSLLKNENQIIRILDVQSEKAFIIDCTKRSMPVWVNKADINHYADCRQQELLDRTNMALFSIEELDAKSKQITYERFSMIAEILSVVSNSTLRNKAIRQVSSRYDVSQQTIRNYLCLYLVYQDKSVLAPKKRMTESELTEDEKNMRWALNKFFYNKNQNSLNTAYTLMLKEKYCDGFGILLPTYPTFNQFRYFYRKTKKIQTYSISRGGLKDYQKNHRPLLGDGIQEFAPNVGTAMLDATVCDIYLVNDSGELIGRPILVLAIDGYSSLCCGYSLLWEGGIYSLRGLMVNILEDKQKICRDFGIQIEKKQWNCCGYIPATLVTDMGSEFISSTFEQIAELGITLINLPAYRPELKGNVEKAFDLIQGYFKPHLKGKGVIEPDFQQRGSHDYRKDACLTLEQFEKVIIRCIVYYNSQRIIENYPYTKAMIQAQIKPYACDIWEYGKLQDGTNLIPATKEQLVMTLLPRATGKFSRYGLIVNKMRYKHENYTEKYLSGGIVTVAYNPDDVSCVWLIENGSYICFELIESRFKGMDLLEVLSLQESHKKVVKGATKDNLQAQIELASHIETIVSSAASHRDVDVKGIRKSRQRERDRNHVDYVRKGGENNA